MNKKVAIIGYGWVGKAMYELFPNSFVYSNHFIVDYKGSSIDIPSGDVEEYRKEVNKADIAFICVPTPNHIGNTVPGATPGTPFYNANEEGHGMLDTSIVEECIAWCECPLIVVRSTVNPGDCDRWSDKYSKCIIMQPEYLGETPQHPLIDTKQTNFIIIGSDNTGEARDLINLYATVYNANIKIRTTSLLTAEVIKLTENRAIAFKVAQCQELYDTCELVPGLDYYTIAQAVYGDDPRFNLWWTFVYPDKRGFNSKCIPKDIYAWCAWAESLGYEPKITRAILEKNKEWII